MRVNPVPPVIFFPKKEKKIENDPKRRKINKRDKAKNS